VHSSGLGRNVLCSKLQLCLPRRVAGFFGCVAKTEANPVGDCIPYAAGNLVGERLLFMFSEHSGNQLSGCHITTHSHNTAIYRKLNCNSPSPIVCILPRRLRGNLRLQSRKGVTKAQQYDNRPPYPTSHLPLRLRWSSTSHNRSPASHRHCLMGN